MFRYLMILSGLASSFFLFDLFSEEKTGTIATNLQLADSARAERNYASFCASCHGEKMDAFVDRRWRHGQAGPDLFKAIKQGYPDEGMPSFDTAFTDQEINELVEYIQKGIVNVERYQFNAKPATNYFSSAGMNIRLDTIARLNNDIAWGMAFLPNHEMLITGRSGKLYKRLPDGSLQTVQGAPQVLAEGQGGLMDVVLHPAFNENKWVYLSYSAYKRTDSGLYSTTAIMRAKLKGDKLVEQQDIFEALPYSRTRHHYGSRMVFDKEGHLYFSVGERGNEKANPQNLANDLGKIHRIKDDGSIPAGNPFAGQENARASIYSYGHRNPQGMALDPATGLLWTNEHGPRGGDEINLVKKGANYGWPVATYGINYNGTVISPRSVMKGIEPPVVYWIPSIAPSGMAIVMGDRYPAWKGGVLTGSLRFKYLNLSIIRNGKPVKEEMLLKNVGRMRDVRMGPDGYIYISVENPGYIFRLVPVEKKS